MFTYFSFSEFCLVDHFFFDVALGLKSLEVGALKVGHPGSLPEPPERLCVDVYIDNIPSTFHSSNGFALCSTDIEFGQFKRLLKAFLFGETAAH